MIVFSTKTEAFKNKQNKSHFEIIIVSCCHGLLVFLNLLPCLIIINYYIYRETCHAQVVLILNNQNFVCCVAALSFNYPLLFQVLVGLNLFYLVITECQSEVSG